MRKMMFSIACAVALTLGGATAALAESDDGSYAPSTPTTPSLAGSEVAPLCVADVPWISYSVVLTDPDGLATSHTARLMLTDGANTVAIPLGEIVDGTLSGRVLWPGASVGTDGRGDGWPGWTKTGGEWVPTTGNYAWTRGAISATLEVNPSLPVTLSYPPSTAACLTGPSGVDALAVGDDPAAFKVSAVSLPSTGGDAAAIVPLIWVAGGLVVAGGTILIVRRARRARD